MRSIRCAAFVSCIALAALGLSLRAQELTLPLKTDSVRFAVIGDMGNGDKVQYEVAGQMIAYRQKFPFEFVMMLGDDLIGAHDAIDYQNKFELPYKALLDAGVKFYAVLGNHDISNERFYKAFNMSGQQYYTYKKGNVRFFALDSNYMKPQQLSWLEKELHELRIGLENLLFPSPALFFRGLPWLFDRPPPSAGTPVPKIRRAGRLCRARSHI